jgi:hypothetical protein
VIYFLEIALLLGLCDLVVAAAVWRLLARPAQRPYKARIIGATLGACLGAWAAEPQLDRVVRQLGLIQEAGGIAMAFTYPLSLPLTTGIVGWLLSELIGGRSTRPARAAALSCAGSLGGAVVGFLVFVFAPFERAIVPIALDESLIFGPLVLVPPIAGSVLAQAWFFRSQRVVGTS